MQFILALCLLYCLSVNLPIAFSLRCYECVDFPGSIQPCSNPSVRHCNHQQDSCRTLVVTGEINQYRYTTTVKDCSSYQYGCNSRNVCNLINESIAEHNGTLLACSVNCCYSDLCNGQVTSSPSTVYPSQRPTRYPTARPTRYPTGYPTARTMRYPTGYHTARPTRYPIAGPGPDPPSQLKYCISLLRDLLVKMEFIVDYELGGNCNRAKRDHIVRINKAIRNVDIDMKRAGRQKQDVTKTIVFDQLKKKAADLIRKLQDKDGQYKRKSLLKLGKKKSELKSRELMRQTAETIKNLFNMEMKQP